MLIFLGVAMAIMAYVLVAGRGRVTRIASRRRDLTLTDRCSNESGPASSS